MPLDPTQKYRNQSNSITLNADKPLKELTRNSPIWSPILLRRKLPMAWGTTIDRVTTEINPFQICKRNKHLTLNDLTTYLILDGWCRSPLSFSTLACISNLLSQHSTNKTSMCYIQIPSPPCDETFDLHVFPLIPSFRVETPCCLSILHENT